MANKVKGTQELEFLKLKLRRLLKEFEDDRARFNRDFTKAESLDKKMVCLTMIADYSYFERRIKKLLEKE